MTEDADNKFKKVDNVIIYTYLIKKYRKHGIL